MLSTYRFLTFFLFPALIILIHFRKLIKKEHKIRYKEKIFSSSFNDDRNISNRLYWFHASSIGETLSIIPLIKKLNKNNQNLDFLITTVTLSSANLIDKELKNLKNIKHRFFPLDVNHLVKNFLDTWKPNLVCFVDSEIWPNFLIEIKKRNIPLALLNGRITQKTFNRWKIFKNFAKLIFNSFDICLTSNSDSKKYLEELKVKNIRNYGNLKFSIPIDSNRLDKKNQDNLNKFTTWCAASTHKGEEFFCLKTHLEIKMKFKNLLTIIIPRHIHRVEDIKKLSQKFKLNSQIFNEGDEIRSDIEVLIINSFGALQKYFAYCNNVFIGKSMIRKLKSVGGQNPIEAAKQGCKIFHGPFVYNFKETYHLLKSYDISEKVENVDELSKKLIENLNKEKKIDQKKIERLNLYGEKILENIIKELNNIVKK
tara:strand:+ start:1945 stop:3219 length:1275 start_codon:yes stop_codon:yes gene_type:complete